MNQDLLNLDISPEDWADIDAAVTVLENKLSSKLIDLSIEQRKTVTKMGNKSEAFCRQTLILARQQVGKLPADFAAALPGAEADLTARDTLLVRLGRLQSVCEKTDDSEMALGSDVMVYCLETYGVLKAIGVGDGLDELRSQVGTRFKRGPRKKPEPTPEA
jgi:hypothetical protein